MSVGKSFPGHQFYPITTPLQVGAKRAAQHPHASEEGAVPLAMWFAMRGHSDPAKQAGMRAYTHVDHATPQAFDEIFAKF